MLRLVTNPENYQYLSKITEPECARNVSGTPQPSLGRVQKENPARPRLAWSESRGAGLSPPSCATLSQRKPGIRRFPGESLSQQLWGCFIGGTYLGAAAKSFGQHEERITHSYGVHLRKGLHGQASVLCISFSKPRTSSTSTSS